MIFLIIIETFIIILYDSALPFASFEVSIMFLLLLVCFCKLFLKVDIEGYEYDILEDMSNVF